MLTEIHFLSIHTYILHVQCSRYCGKLWNDLYFTLNLLNSNSMDIESWYRINQRRAHERDERVGRRRKSSVQRETRAQGDLMESVVMIVNSIVGIQSNSSKGITGKNRRRTKKSVCGFFLFRVFFRLAWKKPCQWYHVKTHQMNYKYVLKSKFLTKKKCDGVRARERERDMVYVEIASFFITFLHSLALCNFIRWFRSHHHHHRLPCFHVSECLKSM